MADLSYNPNEATIQDVLAYIGDQGSEKYESRATAALEAERARNGGARVGVLNALDPMNAGASSEAEAVGDAGLAEVQDRMAAYTRQGFIGRIPGNSRFELEKQRQA